MFAIDGTCSAIGNALARYLTRPLLRHRPLAPRDPDRLRAILRPGDVLLVEGTSRIAAAIKYLTQSTWSHSAFYAGMIADSAGRGPDSRVLIEADLVEGVWAVPLSVYAGFHVRVMPADRTVRCRNRARRAVHDRGPGQQVRPEKHHRPRTLPAA